MNFSPQFAPVEPAARRSLIAVALIILGALIFFARLHTYEEPLERDLTSYAVIAHEMLNGKALYSDLWDHKPPAIHITYAVGELVAGYGRNSIFLLNVMASLATLVACYFAGSRPTGSRIGGVVAAAVWALISGDLSIEGNQPNTEVFLNAFLTAGFAIMVRSENGNKIGLQRAVLAGLLFGMASLYKPVVVAQAALLALVYLASRPQATRKPALVEVAVIAIIGAAMWAGTISYFFALDRGDAFKAAVFTFNHWYAGNIWHNLTQLSRLLRLPDEAFAIGLSLSVLSLVGLFLGLIFGPRRPWLLLVAFSLATHVAVVMPGRFFPHYYQLWLPPLAIGAGWTIASLKRNLPARFSMLSYAVASVVFAVLLVSELPNYRLPANDWSVRKYGDIFLRTDQLARKIDNLLPQDATFYEWGNESGFYFTSRRRPPSGIIAAYPVLTGPLSDQLSGRLINDLKRSNPELIVIESNTLRQTRSDHPIVLWFKENYRPFATAGTFLLFVRNGGKLDTQSPGAVN